ncbi:MAG: T9SS type A sorting domain-containing protein [Bacteroidales bacterium]|nr:T9SS type A sorting domain-containing protein [Bacteroidales bacterium]
MKKLLSITVSVFILFTLKGQTPVGSWTDHLNYNTADGISGNADIIYSSTGASILVYETGMNEIRKLSPVSGLSETGIASTGWSETNSTLIIAYTSLNIDLVRGSSIENIPDILNRFPYGQKKINRIRTRDNYAYLASGYGIIIADIVRKEIRDTWKPGQESGDNEVFDLAFGNGMVYAATAKGLWQADLQNQGLSYPGNWERVKGMPEAICNHVIFAGETIYCNLPGASGDDIIYAISEGVSVFSQSPGTVNRSFDPAPDGFLISSSRSLRYYSAQGTLLKEISYYGWGQPDIFQSLIFGNDIWIADRTHGTIHGKNMTGFTGLPVSGPASNNVADITSEGGRTIICAGATNGSWNGLKLPYMVSVHDGRKFENISSGSHYDAMRAAIDSSDPSRFFVSSWGSGVFIYENNTLVKQFDSSNSPLQESGTSGETRVLGLAQDKTGNLWITQPDVTDKIKVFKSGGTWESYPVNINAPLATDLIATSSGQLWIILPDGYGLFIIDDNGTSGILTDDKTRKLTITDSDNRTINSAFSLAEDLDGSIWVGTGQGPVIYHNPEGIFDSDVRGSRIKVPRNDGSGLADYMLGTETITSIAVDGANRKWLGTLSSGAYLLSADGTTLLKNYNTSNSPLFSDSIASVAINQLTGEVWFGTSGGILSIRENATTGNETFNNVYSFPNPVREDFTGNVTITGLVRDTEVKITDISGNLVSETTSEGGQASWDLSTYNGRRVKSGVYLVFCVAGDGSESCITRIMIISK